MHSLMFFLKKNEKRTGNATEVHNHLLLHLEKPKGTVRADFELPINPIRVLNKFKKRRGSVWEVPFVPSYTSCDAEQNCKRRV